MIMCVLSIFLVISFSVFTSISTLGINTRSVSTLGINLLCNQFQCIYIDINTRYQLVMRN